MPSLGDLGKCALTTRTILAMLSALLGIAFAKCCRVPTHAARCEPDDGRSISFANFRRMVMTSSIQRARLLIPLVIVACVQPANAFWRRCGGDCGCAATCETSCQPCQRTVMVPQTSYETRTITVVEYRPEERTRTYTVHRQVPETRTVEYTVTVPRYEQRTREVSYTVQRP